MLRRGGWEEISSLNNIMEGEIVQTDRCNCLRSMAAVIFDHVLLPSFLSRSEPPGPSLAQKLLAVLVDLALPLHLLALRRACVVLGENGHSFSYYI